MATNRVIHECVWKDCFCVADRCSISFLLPPAVAQSFSKCVDDDDDDDDDDEYNDFIC